MLSWHVDSVVKCGLAGTIFLHGRTNGLLAGRILAIGRLGSSRASGTPKKSFYTLKGRLGQENSALPHRPLPRAPFVSVIVCSYNGGRTLATCLDSLGKLNYPDYEIILVDDGSTDDTRDIAEQFPHVRYIYQENHGLSHARNTRRGGREGRGFRLHRFGLHGGC